MNHLLCLSSGIVTLLAAHAYCQAADRYAAMFSDGTRVQEAEVREWFEPTSAAKIGGKVLFDPGNPVRWIIDRDQPVATEAAMYVEFQGGDRLAGEVTAFQPDSGNTYEHQPAHLLISPLAELQPHDDPQQGVLRVGIDWLRRVVWQRSAIDDYRPNTVWLRSGAMQTFRTLRWSEFSVTLLTTDGIKELPFADIAEIHFPRQDAWNAYYEQLATLTPQLKSRLIQLETIDGSRWTTSIERFQARHHGDRNRPEQWFQLIQPAWSLDPIWLRYRTIRVWHCHAPTDVPLSNLLPTDVKRQAVFGSGWTWRTNQNVQRGPLQSATQEFGWGFGVQASCDLTFEWPETAREWRTQFGLDRTAGSGGFARLSFTVGNGQAIGPQPNLQGSQTVGDTGWLALPALPSDQRRLQLRADMAHVDRPPEADPFDVRDAVNWYEPEIRLDPAALAAEVSGRLLARISGLHGWAATPGDIHSLKLTNFLDVTYARDPNYRLVAGTSDRFYTVSRKLKVGPHQRWLSFAVTRFADATPTSIQVRLDDRSLGEFEVPIRTGVSDPDPILLPVHEFQGKTVSLELVVFPTDEKSLVDWRGTALTAERPGLLTIFEDDPAFASQLNRGMGQVEITDEKPFSGNVSLKVTPDAGDNSRIEGLEATVTDQPQLGQYRYILFAWKQPTGTQVLIQWANDGRLGEQIAQVGRRDQFRRGVRGRLRFDGPADDRGLRYGFSYDSGTPRHVPGAPLRLAGAVPKEWQQSMRDIYNDFGSFNLTGLALKCVDGEAAWFDHIYLARTPQDMEFARSYLVNPRPAPPARDPSVLDQAAGRNDYGRLLAPFMSQFSTMELSHGLMRLKEHAGQTDALRTHPNAQDKPAIFRAGLTLPKDKPAMLDMHVSHSQQADWQLVVKVNGEVIHQELIDQKLTTPQRGWASIQVDLTRFAGQKVLVEVLNQSNNWNNEFAFWKRLAIVEK
ncbi:MAG: hypothetical protein JSS49_24505 [Planctomycetes bacterium]|nr:hypothetical protein [Planctomycetota bacterium]